MVYPAVCRALEPELHAHASHAVADSFVVIASLLVATHVLSALRESGQLCRSPPVAEYHTG